MDAFSWNLVSAAAGLAVVHAAAGPDHTLPFVMLARARGWSLAKTLGVTLLCGLGHLGSSVALGSVGIAMGLGVSRIGRIDSARGSVAAWALVAFGVAYALWGVRRAVRRRRGIELHEHHGHVHLHAHAREPHGHARVRDSGTTFWMLFTVLVLGPCEPLIPLVMLPASVGRWGVATAAGAVFAIATLATMLAIVGAGWAGIRRLPLDRMARWSHALAGGVIAASGLAVLFLGL